MKRILVFLLFFLLFSLQATSVPVYPSPHIRNCVSNELINERFDIKFLQVTKLNISSEFQVFMFNGYGPGSIRTLPSQQKEELVNLLVGNITSRVREAASSYGNQPSVTVDVNETSLQPSATGPITVYAWAEFEMLPSFLGFQNSNFPNSWSLEDIAYGLVHAGLSLKIPVTLRAQPGHNISVGIFREHNFPADVVVTDEIFQPAGSFLWCLINWDGLSEIVDTSHALRMFANKSPLQSGDAWGDFYADIYSIRFISKGDELTFNISLSLSLFTIKVNALHSVRNALPQIFIVEYIPSDVMRLFYALHSNGCLDFSVDSYLEELHGIMDTNLANIFQKEIHTKMTVLWDTVAKPIEIRKMSNSTSININFAVNDVKKLLERKMSFSGLKILSIQRTFPITLPSLKDFDISMNYTFKFPENIKVLDATCPGHDAERDVDNNRRWTVTTRTGKMDEASTLTVTLGADLEYDLAPLTPYLLLIVALLIVWVIVTILVYRKGKPRKRKGGEEGI